MSKNFPKKSEKVLFEDPAEANDSMAIVIERMAACGLDESEISYVTGISVVTLRKFYQQEMTMGLAAVTAKVGGALIKSAIAGNSMDMQFFLRARSRWVTPTKIEHDANVVIDDKRQIMDDIVKMLAKGNKSVPVESKPPPAPAKAPALTHAKVSGKPN